MNRRIARKVLKQHYELGRDRWRHVNAAIRRLPGVFGGRFVTRKATRPTSILDPYIRRLIELSFKEGFSRNESLVFSFLWGPT